MIHTDKKTVKNHTEISVKNIFIISYT